MPLGYGTSAERYGASTHSISRSPTVTADIPLVVPVPEWFGVGSDDVSMGAQLGLGVLRWSSLGGSRLWCSSDGLAGAGR
jgi:hypothetical protein